MTKRYQDADADLKYLASKVVTMVGYGNQGRSQALNLRDNGISVIVGGIHDTTLERAKSDGFEVTTVSDAIRKSDIAFLLVPDEIMPKVFKEDIEPNLKDNYVLNFASGYNIHFGFIVPPKNVDVIMIAPRMIGKGVRDRFVDGSGYPSLVAVHQNASGKAKDIMLALAKALGTTKVGAFESSFEEEAVVDLFGEQVSGGFKLYSIRTSYEILTKAGYSPESVLLELYLSGEGIETQKAAMDIGLWGQLKLHSLTSQYGHMTRGVNSASEATKATLRSILDDIASGKFAKEWTLEQMAGYPVFNTLWKTNLNNDFVKAETELLNILNHREPSNK